MLKRSSRFVLIAAVLWFLVTAYFYAQHERSVWTVEVPGWENLNSQGMQVKEIDFYDWEQKEQLPTRGKLVNWYLGFVGSLPQELQLDVYKASIPVFRVLGFYHDPYASRKGYRIEIYGYALKGQFAGDTEQGNANVFVNGTSIGDWGRQWWACDDSNLVKFQVRTTYYKDTNIDSIRLQWTMEDGACFVQDVPVQELGLHRRILTYFDRDPDYFDDQRTVSALINSKKEDAEKLLSNRVAGQDFPWVRLAWIRDNPKTWTSLVPLAYLGEYEGFKNVFFVVLQRSEPGNPDQAEASQNIYLAEEDNQWRVIDVGELQNLNGGG